MFLRRDKRPKIKIIREWLWPSMGWQRTFLYIRHRLVRLPDTNHQIALGMAIGAAISFTPTPGLHLIQATVYAWLARANIFASLIGTLVGNPWTLVPMWALSYKAGQYMFNMFGLTSPIQGQMAGMPQHNSFSDFWHELLDNPMESLVPWLAGGYAVCLLSLPIFYAVFYYVILQARSAQVSWKKYQIRQEGHSITDKAGT